jgi:hypothetical protein
LLSRGSAVGDGTTMACPVAIGPGLRGDLGGGGEPTLSRNCDLGTATCTVAENDTRRDPAERGDAGEISNGRRGTESPLR